MVVHSFARNLHEQSQMSYPSGLKQMQISSPLSLKFGESLMKWRRSEVRILGRGGARISDCIEDTISYYASGLYLNTDG